MNDIEARFMGGRKGNFLVAYNVQSALDYETKVICAINITQSSTDYLPTTRHRRQSNK